MRLCTHKLVHAFPELDALSSAEGERVLRRVRAGKPVLWHRCISIGLGVAAGWIGLAYAFGPWLSDAAGPLPWWVARLASLFLGTYAGCALGACAGLIARDRMLARALRAGDEALCCPCCRYPLRGLVDETTESVVCPECASVTRVV